MIIEWCIMKSVLLLIILLLSMFVVVSQTKRVNALVITVPDDYSTIQSAINHASAGDTILVRTGVYYEHLTVNKTIRLIGENRNATVIDNEYADPLEVHKSIVLVTADNVKMSGFTIQHCWVGGNAVCIDNYVNMTFFDNIIRGNNEGIRLEHSSGNIVSSNIIQDCYYNTGLVFSYAHNNTAFNNTIIGNPGVGIGSDYESYHNVISGNTIMGNGHGLLISLYNCSFFHNNIIDNSVQVAFYPGSYSNSWDNGYPSGGNYWSDYYGQDASGDGIGDRPYVIDANNRDNYPLMNPWTPPDIAVTNVATSKTVIGQGLILRINAAVRNQGGKIEGFNLTAYCNLTALQINYVRLNSGSSTVVQISWNTTNFAKGSYELAVIASRPEGEVNVLNNIFIFGNVLVTKKGDINGDNNVNVLDLISVATRLGTRPGMLWWDPNADVKEDNVINVLDLIFVAVNLGT